MQEISLLRFFSTKHGFLLNTIFFHQLLSNGTYLILTLAIPETYLFFRKISCGSCDSSQTLCYDCRNTNGTELITRFFWASVICRNINLNIVYKNQYIPYENNVKKFNSQFILPIAHK